MQLKDFLPLSFNIYERCSTLNVFMTNILICQKNKKSGKIR